MAAVYYNYFPPNLNSISSQSSTCGQDKVIDYRKGSKTVNPVGYADQCGTHKLESLKPAFYED